MRKIPGVCRGIPPRYVIYVLILLWYDLKFQFKNYFFFRSF